MYRIGQGFDVHKFSDESPPNGVIMLGGVDIESSFALLAHSHGDVVLHALCDALLGAAGLGDIGQHFSDLDDAYKDMNSDWFIIQAMQMLTDRGYRVVNTDLTIITEAPKINPHRERMVKVIAALLNVPLDDVNVKATTTEKLGFTGRKEGIAAQVIVLITKAEL